MHQVEEESLVVCLELDESSLGLLGQLVRVLLGLVKATMLYWASASPSLSLLLPSFSLTCAISSFKRLGSLFRLFGSVTATHIPHPKPSPVASQTSHSSSETTAMQARSTIRSGKIMRLIRLGSIKLVLTSVPFSFSPFPSFSLHQPSVLS